MTHLTTFIFGALLASVLVGGGIHGDRDACRAAHVGYDCELGWVAVGRF